MRMASPGLNQRSSRLPPKNDRPGGRLALRLTGMSGVAAAVSLFVGTAAFAVPFSDSFVGSTLNPGWTAATNNPANSVMLTGAGQLQMTASPLNGGSDLYPGSNYNAPVILQPVDPSLDWTLETEVVFNPTNFYQAAGILLATTTNPFTSTSQFSRVAQREFYPSDGGDAVENEPSSEYVSYSGTTTWLKVQKVSDVYTTSYSSDGSSWSFVGSDVDLTAYTEIGLFADRQAWDGDMTVSSVPDFNFFAVNVDAEVPEPPSLVPMGTALLGLIWLTVCRSRRKVRLLG